MGNLARCGKRSRDGGCQATLIQPLTNFQHFASAAEPNQQMIKHQIQPKHIVSICPSICSRNLLLASCLDCPARTWVPRGRTPKGQPKTSRGSRHRFAGAGFDPWDWAGAASQIFLNRTEFLSTTQEKKCKLAKCPPGRGDSCRVRERRSTVTSWEPLPGFILVAFFKQNHA